MFTLLRGATVYTPSELGQRDVLICAGKIVHITEPSSPLPQDFLGQLEIVDLRDRILVPGLIDQHLHIIGGGGGDGPASRIPEIMLSDITRWGITTAIGCLGLDTEAKSLETLLAKAHALDAEGITTFIYGGGFKFPPDTLLDNIRADLMLIEKMVGVKLALGEELGSHLTKRKLAQLASDVLAGGKLGGKPGIIHIHLGECSGFSPFTTIRQAIRISGVAPKHFVITHINWSEQILKEACEFAKVGTYLNVDGIFRQSRGAIGVVEPENALLSLREAGVPWEQLTLATDGNASVPRVNKETGERGVYQLGTETLLQTVRLLTQTNKVSFANALEVVTSNPARVLGLFGKKGVVQPGADADIVILTRDLEVDRVYACGRLIVANGRSVLEGMFEAREHLDKLGNSTSIH